MLLRDASSFFDLGKAILVGLGKGALFWSKVAHISTKVVEQQRFSDLEVSFFDMKCQIWPKICVNFGRKVEILNLPFL